MTKKHPRLAPGSVKLYGHVCCLLSKHLPASLPQNPAAGAVGEPTPPEGGPAQRPRVAGEEPSKAGPGEAASPAGGSGQPGTSFPLDSTICVSTQQGDPLCLQGASGAVE